MSDKKINVLIPMAGRGKRFVDAGYTIPKPLLEIDDKPVVEHVINNMAVDGGHFIFLILKEHSEKYNLDKILKEKVPDCDIIIVDEITEGAACTALLAANLIDNDTPLILKDCDQIIDWEPKNFFRFMERNKADAGIITIYTNDKGFSFIAPSQKGKDYFYVSRTAEKMTISNIGAAGLYYFSKGSSYVKYANEMIRKNIRTNGEFYICPVYNEILNDGLTVLFYPIAQMLSLGTPADFEANKTRVSEILYKK